MAIQMKDLLGGAGGGVFRVISFQSGRIASGQPAGVILTKDISDVVGATAIRIKHLLCSSTAVEPSMLLTTSDGLSLSGGLDDVTPSTTTADSSNFCVVPYFTSTTNLAISARVLSEIMCSSFELSKSGGATTQSIDWAIEFGVIE